MTNQKKLPLPLSVDDVAKCEIIDTTGCMVADCWDNAYASEIVKRCNLHDGLMAALKEAMEFATRQTGDATCGKAAYKLSEKLRILLENTKGE